MKSTTELLKQLKSRDIHVQLDGDNLRINAPKGALSEELRALLAEHKADIIEFFRSQSNQKRFVIPGINRTGLLPLSPAQERVWQLHALDPGNSSLNITGAWRIKGDLDADKLETALNSLIARHEILRTKFVLWESTPHQLVIPAEEAPAIKLNRKMLQDQDTFPSNTDILDLVVTDTQRPFNLEAPLLFRAGVLAVRPQEHIIYLVIHQIVIDGDALDSMLSELASHYEGLPLEPLPIQFGDYAVWSHKYLNDKNQTLVKFWSEVFSRPYHPLPIRSSNKSTSASVAHSLSPDSANQLQKFVQENETTPFIMGVALFQILLAGYSDVQDVIVFTTASGRTNKELQHLIGLFAHPIAIRSEIQPEETFIEWLRGVSIATQGAISHKELPLDKILEQAQVVRQKDSSGLFQAMFSLKAEQALIPLNSEIGLENLNIEGQRAQFDIHLHLTIGQGAVDLHLQFREGVFSSQAASRLLNDFEALLARVLEKPESSVASLMDVLSGKNSIQALDKAENFVKERSANFELPRNTLETQLKKSWEKIFGIEDIGIHDDFFEMGGDSMLAIRLFNIIETSMTGEKLPLTLLTQARTIAGVADALQNKNWDRAVDTLVPIKPEGSRTPFFGIHPAQGLILNFYELASLLDEDRPFYGLRTQEWTEGGVPTSVPALAATYLQRIKSVQPNGPYIIGGYCFGGQVAFEMVHQLEELGDEVSLLVLIDSYAPGGAVSIQVQETTAARYRRRLRLVIDEFQKRNIAEAARYLGAILQRGWQRIKIRATRHIVRPLKRKAWVWGVKVTEKLNLTLPAFMQDFGMAKREAMTNYAPKPVSAPVLSIRAKDRSPYFEYKENMGWSPFVKGQLKIKVIPGDHFTLFDSSNHVHFKKVLKDAFFEVDH